MISNTPLDYALNNRIGQTTTQLELTNSLNAQVDIVSVTFTTASGGYIHFSSSVYFAVPTGTTVNKLKLYKTGTIIGIETLTPETFTTNGTFTVNDIQITLGEG